MLPWSQNKGTVLVYRSFYKRPLGGAINFKWVNLTSKILMGLFRV